MKANTVVHGLATGAVGLNAFDGRPTLPLPHDGSASFNIFKFIKALSTSTVFIWCRESKALSSPGLYLVRFKKNVR